MTPALEPPPAIELSEKDQETLARVEPSLESGLEIYRWWRETERRQSYSDKFPLRRSAYDTQPSFGFFDEARLSFGKIPVLGVVQGMPFGRTAHLGAREQIREFLLKYFLRVADFERPAAYSLRDLEGKTDDHTDPGGWGYTQCYYKLRGGRVGKFPAAAQHRIVDLREIAADGLYEWVVLRARLFNIEVDVSPLGDEAPHLVVPLAKFTEEYLILSPEFIIDDEDPAPGIRGRYGLGYATLHDPSSDAGPLLWGPGRFHPGFESFVFEVRQLADGNTEVTVSSPFAVNRPERIFGLNPDPISLGVQVADGLSLGLASRLFPDLKKGFDPLLTPVAMLSTLTGGLSGRALGLTIDNVERYFMVQHFLAAYGLLTGSLLTFAQVPDWTADEASMPFWVREGRVER